MSNNQQGGGSFEKKQQTELSQRQLPELQNGAEWKKQIKGDEVTNFNAEVQKLVTQEVSQLAEQFASGNEVPDLEQMTVKDRVEYLKGLGKTVKYFSGWINPLRSALQSNEVNKKTGAQGRNFYKLTSAVGKMFNLGKGTTADNLVQVNLAYTDKIQAELIEKVKKHSQEETDNSFNERVEVIKEKFESLKNKIVEYAAVNLETAEAAGKGSVVFADTNGAQAYERRQGIVGGNNLITGASTLALGASFLTPVGGLLAGGIGALNVAGGLNNLRLMEAGTMDQFYKLERAERKNVNQKVGEYLVKLEEFVTANKIQGLSTVMELIADSLLALDTKSILTVANKKKIQELSSQCKNASKENGIAPSKDLSEGMNQLDNLYTNYENITNPDGKKNQDNLWNQAGQADKKESKLGIISNRNLLILTSGFRIVGGGLKFLDAFAGEQITLFGNGSGSSDTVVVAKDGFETGVDSSTTGSVSTLDSNLAGTTTRLGNTMETGVGGSVSADLATNPYEGVSFANMVETYGGPNDIDSTELGILFDNLEDKTITSEDFSTLQAIASNETINDEQKGILKQISGFTSEQDITPGMLSEWKANLNPVSLPEAAIAGMEQTVTEGVEVVEEGLKNIRETLAKGFDHWGATEDTFVNVEDIAKGQEVLRQSLKSVGIQQDPTLIAAIDMEFHNAVTQPGYKVDFTRVFADNFGITEEAATQKFGGIIDVYDKMGSGAEMEDITTAIDEARKHWQGVGDNFGEVLEGSTNNNLTKDSFAGIFDSGLYGAEEQSDALATRLSFWTGDVSKIDMPGLNKLLVDLHNNTTNNGGGIAEILPTFKEALDASATDGNLDDLQTNLAIELAKIEGISTEEAQTIAGNVVSENRDFINGLGAQIKTYLESTGQIAVSLPIPAVTPLVDIQPDKENWVWNLAGEATTGAGVGATVGGGIGAIKAKKEGKSMRRGAIEGAQWGAAAGVLGGGLAGVGLNAGQAAAGGLAAGLGVGFFGAKDKPTNQPSPNDQPLTPSPQPNGGEGDRDNVDDRNFNALVDATVDFIQNDNFQEVNSVDELNNKLTDTVSKILKTQYNLTDTELAQQGRQATFDDLVTKFVAIVKDKLRAKPDLQKILENGKTPAEIKKIKTEIKKAIKETREENKKPIKDLTDSIKLTEEQKIQDAVRLALSNKANYQTTVNNIVNNTKNVESLKNISKSEIINLTKNAFPIYANDKASLSTINSFIKLKFDKKLDDKLQQQYAGQTLEQYIDDESNRTANPGSYEKTVIALVNSCLSESINESIEAIANHIKSYSEPTPTLQQIPLTKDVTAKVEKPSKIEVTVVDNQRVEIGGLKVRGTNADISIVKQGDNFILKQSVPGNPSIRITPEIEITEKGGNGDFQTDTGTVNLSLKKVGDKVEIQIVGANGEKNIGPVTLKLVDTAPAGDSSAEEASLAAEAEAKQMALLKTHLNTGLTYKGEALNLQRFLDGLETNTDKESILAKAAELANEAKIGGKKDNEPWVSSDISAWANIALGKTTVATHLDTKINCARELARFLPQAIKSLGLKTAPTGNDDEAIGTGEVKEVKTKTELSGLIEKMQAAEEKYSHVKEMSEGIEENVKAWKQEENQSQTEENLRRFAAFELYNTALAVKLFTESEIQPIIEHHKNSVKDAMQSLLSNEWENIPEATEVKLKVGDLILDKIKGVQGELETTQTEVATKLSDEIKNLDQANQDKINQYFTELRLQSETGVGVSDELELLTDKLFAENGIKNSKLKEILGLLIDPVASSSNLTAKNMQIISETILPVLGAEVPTVIQEKTKIQEGEGSGEGEEDLGIDASALRERAKDPVTV